MKQSILFIGISLFLFSCSIQKRQYTSGFYSEWNQKHEKQAQVSKQSYYSDSLAALQVNDITQDAPMKVILVAATTPKNSSSLTGSGENPGCDTILMMNGTRVIGSITEVNPDQVIYTNCGDAKGVHKYITKKSVARIRYSDGLVSLPANEHFNELDTKFSPPLTANSVFKHSVAVRGPETNFGETGCGMALKVLLYIVLVVGACIGIGYIASNG